MNSTKGKWEQKKKAFPLWVPVPDHYVFPAWEHIATHSTILTELLHIWNALSLAAALLAFLKSNILCDALILAIHKDVQRDHRK